LPMMVDLTHNLPLFSYLFFFIVYITWIAKFLNKLICKTDVCF